MTEKTYKVLRPYRDRNQGRTLEKDETVTMQPRLAAHLVGSHLTLAEGGNRKGGTKSAKTSQEGASE